MTSKYTMSDFTGSAMVFLWLMEIGQSWETLFARVYYPKVVETLKGSQCFLRRISNSVETYGVTKYKLAPRSNKVFKSKVKTLTILVTISGELLAVSDYIEMVFPSPVWEVYPLGAVLFSGATYEHWSLFPL